MDSTSAPPILFPRRLAAGDLIGIAAPASPPDKPEIIDESIARLTEFGFKIKPGKFLRRRASYLAGSDEERAHDINDLFADPEVKGVFALRGGYGSCRILPLLDYETIRANPKPFIGYSDITAMHLAILSTTGLVTFHGSNATSAFTPGNEVGCRRILMEEPEAKETVLFARDRSRGELIKTITPGQVSGQVLGGNMTCLSRLIGTPYAPDFSRAVLFLEDTGEKAYRVDGLFTHLRLAGILQQVKGLIIGQFDHPDIEEQARIEQCLEREAKRLNIPCVSGAPIGHFAEQVVMPQGVEVVFDATEGLLKAILP